MHSYSAPHHTIRSDAERFTKRFPREYCTPFAIKWGRCHLHKKVPAKNEKNKPKNAIFEENSPFFQTINKWKGTKNCRRRSNRKMLFVDSSQQCQGSAPRSGTVSPLARKIIRLCFGTNNGRHITYMYAGRDVPIRTCTRAACFNQKSA